MSVEKKSRGYDWKAGQRATYQGKVKGLEEYLGKAGKITDVQPRKGLTPMVTIVIAGHELVVAGGCLHRSAVQERREKRRSSRKKGKGRTKRAKKNHRKKAEQQGKKEEILTPKVVKKLRAVHKAIMSARKGAPVPFDGNVDGALSEEECATVDAGLVEFLTIVRGALKRRGVVVMTPLDIVWPAVDALENAAQKASKEEDDTGCYALTFLANRLDDSSSILERWFRMDKEEPDKIRLGAELRRRGLLQ